MNDDEKVMSEAETAQSEAKTADGEAETLRALIGVDFKLQQLNKEFEELPHRSKILELRAKLRELEDKLEQVGVMRKENNRALRLLQDEEAMVNARCQETQAKIKASTNYKETTALTRELDSYNQKIENIETESLKNLEKLDKINEVESQVSSVISKLKTQEADLIEQFKEAGGTLKEAIARETSAREALCARLSDALMKRYEKAVIAKGGVGASFIESGRCKACHLPFSEGQLMSLKGKGPLTECPHCHRVLITTSEEL